MMCDDRHMNRLRFFRKDLTQRREDLGIIRKLLIFFCDLAPLRDKARRCQARESSGATGDYARLRGDTYYTITSNTSFSGSGETWVRTGSF